MLKLKNFTTSFVCFVCFVCLLCFPHQASSWIEGGFDKIWEDDDKKIKSSRMTTTVSKSSGGSYIAPITGMEFVFIKGGCFMMGSLESEKGATYFEHPIHEVCVDDFYMGKYEVTNGQYRKKNKLHNSGTFKRKSLNQDNQPAVRVSWKDADNYASWLSKKNGEIFRLPTEAEWEYAARGGTTTSRYWGDNEGQACAYGNFYDITSRKLLRHKNWSHFECNDGHGVAAPVGSYRPNAYGLFDVLGNAEEWVSDWKETDYYSKSPQNNPKGPSEGKYRVARGGSYYIFPSYVRSAFRGGRTPRSRAETLGFRLLFSVKQ